MVRLTDRPDMTLDVYRGRKTTIQQQQQIVPLKFNSKGTAMMNTSASPDSLLIVRDFLPFSAIRLLKTSNFV